MLKNIPYLSFVIIVRQHIGKELFLRNFLRNFAIEYKRLTTKRQKNEIIEDFGYRTGSGRNNAHRL